MDASTLVDVGILVEDTNDIALGGGENPSSGDDRNVTHLVIVDAFHMDGPMSRCRDDAHVSTGQTAVSAAIDQRVTKLV